MKRIITTIIIVIIAISSPIVARAQIDPAQSGFNAWLGTMLEKWQSSMIVQWGKELDSSLSTLQSVAGTYENTAKVAEWIGDRVKNIQDATEFVRVFDDYYNTLKNTYTTGVYTFKYAQDMLSKGLISPSQFAQIVQLTNYTIKDGLYTWEETKKLFSLNSGNMSTSEWLNVLKAKIRVQKAKKDALKYTLKDMEEEANIKKEGDAFNLLLNTAYTEAKDKNKAILPTSKKEFDKAQKQGEKAATKYTDAIDKASSDGGKALNKITSKISSKESANNTINIVTLIVGLLGVILMLPAYFRLNKGEKQAQDALFKVFIATIVVLVLIQSVGRLLLGAI